MNVSPIIKLIHSRNLCGLWIVIICLLSGCDNLLDDNPAQPAITPVNIRIEPSQIPTQLTDIVITPDLLTPTLLPTLTPFPFGLEEAVSVMSGICFESANDAVDQVFVMRNADEHIHFYDLAENYGLCRRPIIRNPFDFSNGRILAGIWTAGAGCVADHEILEYQRDDAKKVLGIRLKFTTTGDCPYELVRPFWVAIDNASDYQVFIDVERGS